MKEPANDIATTVAVARVVAWKAGMPVILRRRAFRAAMAACVLAIFYWGFIASNRYVSEAHVVIVRTDEAGSQAKAPDLGAMLAGSAGGSRVEQLMLRDHLLSVDMLNRLEDKLRLRAHYSDIWRDPLSQMWFENASLEWFHRHYLSRTSVEFDDNSGVLVVRAQAYDPKTAHAVAALLVEEGERAMNELAHSLAREQLAFVEQEAAQAGERFQRARQAVVAFQNSKGLVSPQATAESLAGNINRLEATLTEMQARRSALLGYLSPQAPGVIDINMQIRAVEQQIAKEQSRLTSPGGSKLNSTVEEYQRLEMAAMLAQDVYKTALAALEKARIESTRSLRKVVALQKPTYPEYPMEPTRIYNIVVFILTTFIVTGIFHLLAAIVRDHKE